MQDALTWLVVYADGTRLAEYAADGTEHGWGEVGSAQVRAVCLMYADGATPFVVAIPPGRSPVFFRRRSIEVALEDGSEVRRTSATCLGWDGDGAYLWIYEDGSVALTTHKD